MLYPKCKDRFVARLWDWEASVSVTQCAFATLTPPSSFQAAMALGNLSVNDDVELAIVAKNGVPALLVLLTSPAVELHRQVRWIASLSRLSPEN
jgi:hypothetical protein